MPVSKRDKKVSLTKTPKKGMVLKQQLVEEIRKHLDKYNNLFVFTVDNMRNGPLKDVREEWKDSRFFFAKRKVMALALGRTEADEMHKNIHKLAGQLVGQCGLLFTNRPKNEVIEWFRDYSQLEFAKSGFVATETVKLPAGPLPDFTFSLEPHLRSLGLPTNLQKGVIMLREDYTVCNENARLTPEQADILKLFGKKMAEFKLKIVCMWSKDGSFEIFKVPKENLKITKTPDNTKKTKAGKETKSGGKLPPKVTSKPPSPELNKEKDNTPKGPVKTIQGKTTKPIRKNSMKFVKATESEEELDHLGKMVQLNESPKPEKVAPRRSMRTPKAIKRTPEQKTLSVKKLTESNKQIKTNPKDRTPTQTRSTPKRTPKQPLKSTPRKSVSKKIFKLQETEDVEMAE